jgi:hypothetical protein
MNAVRIVVTPIDVKSRSRAHGENITAHMGVPHTRQRVQLANAASRVLIGAGVLCSERAEKWGEQECKSNSNSESRTTGVVRVAQATPEWYPLVPCS